MEVPVNAFDVLELLNEMDELELRETGEFLRETFREPLSLTTEQIIKRHRERLRNLIN